MPKILLIFRLNFSAEPGFLSLENQRTYVTILSLFIMYKVTAKLK